MNTIVKTQVKNFGFSPKIKFLGRRTLHATQASTSNTEVKKTASIPEVKASKVQDTPQNSYIYKNLPKSFKTFNSSFDSMKNDYDIPRLNLSEEEIDIVNFGVQKIDDWRKIKQI